MQRKVHFYYAESRKNKTEGQIYLSFFEREYLFFSLHSLFTTSNIKNSSRVPAYQNLKIIGGFCDYFFKPLANDWREVCIPMLSLAMGP